MRYGYDPASQRVERDSYSSAPPRRLSRPRRTGRIHPLLTAACLACAAALCVALLLSRAEITALHDECSRLAGEIEELADENAHLTIEYESMFPLEEVESYARNVLGMAPAAG